MQVSRKDEALQPNLIMQYFRAESVSLSVINTVHVFGNRALPNPIPGVFPYGLYLSGFFFFGLIEAGRMVGPFLRAC